MNRLMRQAMVPQRWPSAALLLLAGITFAACRQRTVSAPPTPLGSAWPRDEHCWWTAIRTTLPVDSVSGRFARAFASVSLTGVVSQRFGDTVLVRGGPTELGDASNRAVYASRVVAYQHGDSTRFRWYSSVTPRLDGASAAETESSGRRIGFCGQIGKAVAISGMAPHDPTADDSLPVWGRVP